MYAAVARIISECGSTLVEKNSAIATTRIVVPVTCHRLLPTPPSSRAGLARVHGRTAWPPPGILPGGSASVLPDRDAALWRYRVVEPR
jgi:hypothetical protein